MEPTKHIQTIVGEHIYLSPILVDDAPLYTQMVNNLQNSVGLGYMTFSNVIDEENERQFLSLLKNKHNFAVRLKENDELLGNISFTEVNILHKNAVLGIMLGNIDHQRKGFGMEAILLLLDYGFSLLNLQSISLNVYEYNEIAYRLYQKIGFKEVGRLRKRIEIMGKRYDEIIMDILREEFQQGNLQKQLSNRYKF